MFKQLTRGLLLAALVGMCHDVAPADAAARSGAEKIRVLIIDGQNNHNWRATTPVMKKALENTGRFTVEVATTPEKINGPKKPKDDNDQAAQAKYKEDLERFQSAQARYRQAMDEFHPDLGKYDVVLSNYNGDSWGKAFQTELEKSLKAGKIALVIVHAANNSFTNWLEYNRMIGMGWRGNGFGDRLTLDEEGKAVRVPKGQGPGAGHGAQHPFQVIVRDDSHPITRGMPKEWMHAQDELYHGMRGPIENVTLLATAYSDKAKGGTGEHEPMIWTVTYGKGRVFHTPMGHDVNGMRCVGFLTTLARGTEWGATGRVTLPIPDTFPTAEKTSSLSSN